MVCQKRVAKHTRAHLLHIKTVVQLIIVQLAREQLSCLNANKAKISNVGKSMIMVAYQALLT